jgi:hypothetical protein
MKRPEAALNIILAMMYSGMRQYLGDTSVNISTDSQLYDHGLLLENAFGDLRKLCREWHGEFVVYQRIVFILTGVCSLRMNAINLALKSLSLSALLPYAMPIALLIASDLEHVFRRVLIGTALASAISFEVVEQSVRVFSDIAEIDRLPATTEEKETVELLE